MLIKILIFSTQVQTLDQHTVLSFWLLEAFNGRYIFNSAQLFNEFSGLLLSLKPISLLCFELLNQESDKNVDVFLATCGRCDQDVRRAY